MSTEKVSSTGRYGSRYGVGIRKRLLKVEPKQFGRKICPSCGAKNVVRTSKGVFNCRKCLIKFVGGAYVPQTLAGGIIAQMVALKSFVPAMIESLEKGKEEEAAVTEPAQGNESKEGAQ